MSSGSTSPSSPTMPTPYEAMKCRFDFHMTDVQKDQALAIESFAPELADLRVELCPSHMKEDAEILSDSICRQDLIP